MNANELKTISKYLSKHLRHEPERLGLELEPGGWVEVEALLSACRARNFPITREQLDRVVAENDKKRFSFDETGGRIRANQGHSVEVDLQLETAVPPDVLYHGTGERSVEAILADGLRKMSRHHVHLSADTETARRVGMRHGRPVILEVDARAMAEEGYLFHLSANGVWLVDVVPARFLRKRIQELGVSIGQGGVMKTTLRLNKVLLVIVVLMTALEMPRLHAQENPMETGEPYTISKDLVIAGSSKSYSDARRTAAVAAKRLGLPLNLGGNVPHATNGLTLSKKGCEENGFEYPCYVGRGRYDDGAYVSIEHTSAYSELTPGLYIVVVASGPAGEETIMKAERAARAIIPDAYVRRVGIYMGCIH